MLTTTDEMSTRDRVVESAIACFARDSIRATNIEDIARTAGVHRVTVHRLFPGGRAELVQATIDRSFARLQQPILDAVAKSSDPGDAVTSVLLEAIVHLRRDPLLSEALTSEEGRAAVTGTAVATFLPLVRTTWSAVSDTVDAAGWTGYSERDGVRVVDHVVRVITTLASDVTAPRTRPALRRYLEDFITPGLTRPA